MADLEKLKPEVSEAIRREIKENNANAMAHGTKEAAILAVARNKHIFEKHNKDREEIARSKLIKGDNNEG